MDHLWAGWRSSYIESVTDPNAPTVVIPEGSSLFEQILTSGLADDEAYVVHRGERCSALLNAYPYTNGHLLVLPNRVVPELADLDDAELLELWSVVRDAITALRSAYHCDGVNVGMNLGQAAGAGLPDHLHIHVLPRWHGDTNFMTAVAETRVLPEPLGTTWQKLHDAWPR